MVSELDQNPARAIALCGEAHARVLATAAALDDEAVRRPSRLPGWTIGHVLTHLARNAEGHTRRLGGALRGEAVERYPGGSTQRVADIEAGAGRPATAIAEDLAEAQGALEEIWAQSAAAGWPHAELEIGDHWPTTGSPVRRLREVEIHHVDLGLGYGPDKWSDEYVAWELPALLATVPERLHHDRQRRLLIAWLSGRSPLPDSLELEPW